MIRKITLASALCLGLILSACGGGGSDGDSASSGQPANASVSNSGTSAGGTGAGSTATPGSSSNRNGSGSAGAGTSGSGGAGTGGSGSSGSGGSGSSGAGDSGSSGSGKSGTGGQDSSGASDTSGSGDSGSSGSSDGSDSSGSDATGSGSSEGTSSGGADADIGNTIPVLVSSASSVRNYPLVSVTICKPGSTAQTSCATINNVLLDTGSFGLRLYASVVPAVTLAALPIQTDISSGRNVAACAAFGSGYTWGSLRNADVKLGGEIAASVPIQIMSDPAIVSRVPGACVWNTSLNSPASLGANGILGVGVSRYDCGTACAGSTPRAGYYYADANPATAIAMPFANQVTNPVSLFPVDNNGVIVEMPTVPGDGAPTAAGTVTFGIDTQANNALAGTGATVFNTDLYGNFTGSLNGANSVSAFIDSGSNALIFRDATIAQRDTFYTPASPLTRSVALNSSNGSAAMVNLDIGNATSLFASINHAFSNLAAYMDQTIDLGMPFFYGQRIYYGIAGKSSNGGGSGPYVAFVSR